MPDSRFHTKRCRHGLAIGLCEDRTCEGSTAVARTRDASVTRLEAPRCGYCKQQRGDAVLRDIPVRNKQGRKPRLCDDCLAGREIRDEAAAVRAKFVTPWRNGRPARARSNENR